MKQHLFTSLISLFIPLILPAQTSLIENFDDNSSEVTFGWNTTYDGEVSNNEVAISITDAGPDWQVFTINFDALDLSESPYVSIKMRTQGDMTVRMDLQDVDGNNTNGSPLSELVLNSSYETFLFDFTDRFVQSWPAAAVVDPTQIHRIMIFVNPGGQAFSGTLYLDDLQIGSVITPPQPPYLADVFVNQIGYYPDGKKLAVVRDTTLSEFYVRNTASGDTVYTGELAPSQEWSYAGNTFRVADFTSLEDLGNFEVLVPGFDPSHPFEITMSAYEEVGIAGLKGYYHQRSGAEVTAEHGGVWARAAGHPDTQVLVHASAASTDRPEGTIISSPYGWYDAGDYNKYIVNSGVSTYTVLAMYEHMSTYFESLETNIPESGNAIPDVLDEALWNVRWMLSMQDPFDGGVYHKLTNETFSHGVMPAGDNSTRYVVQKGTAATLDFAAVMAQSYRVFSHFTGELPGLADSCLIAAQAAWNWASSHPDVDYEQPEGFNTGVYGDENFADEFNWAAAELFITTQLDSFYTAFNPLRSMGIPSWQSVDGLAWISLAMHRHLFDERVDTTRIKSRVLDFADDLRDEYQSSAFGVAMGESSWNFTWGSNGVAGNQSLVLLQAYFMTQDSSYLDAAQANLDYLLGRNPTGYCFLTGYGEVSPLHIHHRISDHDGVVAPVPGLIAGGPNPGQQDVGPQPWACQNYISDLPALSYLDEQCSYASNEITINWNAPFVYTALVLEALEAGHSALPQPFTPGELCMINCPIGFDERIIEPQWSVFPNPTSGAFQVISEVTPTQVQLLDVTGRPIEIQEVQASSFRPMEELSAGVYQLMLLTEKGTWSKPLMIH